MKRTLLTVSISTIAFIGCIHPMDVLNAPDAKQFPTSLSVDAAVQEITSHWVKAGQIPKVSPFEGGKILELYGADVVVRVWSDSGVTQVRYGMRPVMFRPDWYEAGVLSAKR